MRIHATVVYPSALIDGEMLVSIIRKGLKMFLALSLYPLQSENVLSCSIKKEVCKVHFLSHSFFFFFWVVISAQGEYGNF
jgi:hypothetical protein